MKKILFVSLISFLFFNLPNGITQCNNSWDHGKSYKKNHEKDVVDIAIGSEVHTTLVAAVKAAGLVNTLKSGGPFTVFAPTNTAFNKLPEGKVATLLEEDNKKMLSNILTYHVVPSKLDATTLVASINAAGGSFSMKTVSGGKLTAKLMNGSVVLVDENGGESYVTATDLTATNGVVHVIDTVVLPK